MNPDWRAFLDRRGARWEGERLSDFGDPAGERAATGGDLLCDLSHLGLIEAHGADARDFLQNMLTNDLRQVSPEQSRLAALLSPKGRMLGLFRVFQRGEGLWLNPPAATLEPLLKRLRMFVLRAKVTLEERSSELARMGVSGPNVAALLPAVPATDQGAATVDGVTILRVAGATPRFELYGPAAELAALWERLAAAGAREVGAPVWEGLEIAAGLPAVYPETVEAFVPQMANLHRVGGISFTKGCYPGQEVVARSQYLGKLKRRMYRLRVAEAVPPPAGSEIEAETERGADHGKVVRAWATAEGTSELLAVLPIEAAESGRIRLDGASLELLPLPYPFEEAAG